MILAKFAYDFIYIYQLSIPKENFCCIIMSLIIKQSGHFGAGNGREQRNVQTKYPKMQSRSMIHGHTEIWK